MKLGEQLKQAQKQAERATAQAEAKRSAVEQERIENRKRRLNTFCVRALATFEEKILGGDPEPRVHVGAANRELLFKKWFAGKRFSPDEKWAEGILNDFNTTLTKRGLKLGYTYRKGTIRQTDTMFITVSPLDRPLITKQ